MDLEQLASLLSGSSSSYESLTVGNVVFALSLTFVMSLYIFYVYRRTFKGVVYTREYNVSLVLTGLVVALVVLPIRSNLSLSLGMVGALSIIRFRTAVKDPKDIVFTFWAIAVGIVCGSGLYMIALVGVPLIGLFLYVLEHLSLRFPDPYLVVVHYLSEADREVQRTLPKYELQSRTENAGEVELMGEIRMDPKVQAGLLNRLLKISGVKDASIVRYTSDSL